MPTVQQASRRKSDKQFRDQLILACNERDFKGTRRLRLVAKSMVDEAIDGNVTAQTAIRDTLDGKPAQGITVAGDPENPLLPSLDDAEVARRLAGLLYRADMLVDGGRVEILDMLPAISST